MKLKDFIYFNNAIEGDYGIEIEVEGANLPELDNKFWTAHPDGSLRGEAYEYVTKGAIPIEDVSKAIKSLNQSFARKESKLALSFRTSVHVHMNVREMELEKLGSVIYLYYIYEELLVKFCGEERIGNRFCLRLRDSEELPRIVIDAFDTKFGSLDPNQHKYSALNIAPIRRYGSIEFRSMRGTVDVETISTWVSLLNCLKDSPFNSANEVQMFLEEKGTAALNEAVFGNWFRYIAFEGWEREVVHNISLAIELPYRLRAPAPAIYKKKDFKIEVNRAADQLERMLGMRQVEPNYEEEEEF